MAIVNSDFLAALFTNYKAIFRETFDAMTGEHEKIATIIPSTAKQESYNWLGAVPNMEEWLGPRTYSDLLAHNFTIVNKHFQAAIKVDIDDLEDDNYDQIKPRIQELSQVAQNYYDQLVEEQLASGFTALCYDGQYFFDTDHSEGASGTQSNKGTSAFTPAVYGTTRAAMRRLKNDQGRPMKIRPGMLVVPPEMAEGTAKQTLQGDWIPGTANRDTNVYKGTAELYAGGDYLTDANNWFLLDVSRPIKPLALQDRKKPEFVAVDALNADSVFENNEAKYGVDMRCNTGFMLWQLAYGHLVT